MPLVFARQLGHGRVGAHSARVRAAVPVDDALVVARWLQRPRVHAVAQREQRQLSAGQALFHHRARVGARHIQSADPGGGPRVKRALHEDLPQCRQRLLGRVRHRHALARREAVRLHHHSRVRQFLHCGLALLERAHMTPACGRHPGLLHHLLGERLGALQTRRCGATGRRPTCPRRSSSSTRPATSGASGPTTVKWTPSRSTAATIPSTSSAATSIRRASRAMPGVAGGAQQLRFFLGARQRPHERVLAPAAADDEDLHVRVKR